MAKTSKTNLLAASEQVLRLAAKRRERMAERAGKTTASAAPAKKVKAKAKVAADVPNGGFNSELEPVGDLAEGLGKEDIGLHVPPELEDAVEEDREVVDETYQPGILIPPGLEDAVMAVADPASMVSGEAVRFDLIPFGPPPGTPAAEVLSAGAHWILCANGEPLARIALKDQEHADRIAAHFISPDYAKNVIDGLQKHGMEKTLAAVKAKPYVAVVDQQKKVVEAQQKLAAAAETQLRAKTAEVQDTFVKNLGLVLEASANNFLVENELKDSLIASMGGVGLPEDIAGKLVDDAFFAKGAKTIAAMLDKAREWANHTPEAMKEITATVKAAGRTRRPLPSNMSPAASNPNYDHALAARMQSAAVPVTNAPEATVSASVRVGSPEAVPADEKTAYRQRFGRFRSF